ncbi:thiamine pyrophosphate-binding protein [Streptacidiphilus sp. EB129]|uniref:thiamine pyrophosphate-binding protein n=1 Tax=Streptacidiphilus sp. EB129 TaxID=3156262 RepID=UPI003512ED07
MAGQRNVRVADYLIQSLGELGTRHLFGVGGANIEDLYDATAHSLGAVTGILAKHEFGASSMADGYSRSSNRLGLVVATSGGGAMNLVPGLAEAHASRVPLLALVGEPPTALHGRGAFQDTSGLGGSFDAQILFATVSRLCARVSEPAAVPELLARAVDAARTPIPGPAVLLLPKDIQQATIADPPPLRELLSASRDHAEDAGRARERERVSGRLAAVRRSGGQVLIIAGDGVARADCRTELASLASVLGARVAVAPDARDVFDNADPHFAGVAGVMGHPGVRDCAQHAGTWVLVGTRLPHLVRAGLEEAQEATTVISLDEQRPFIQDTLSLCGDLRGELRHLLRALGPKKGAEQVACGPHHDAHHSQQPPDTAGSSMREAVEAVATALPAAADVFIDAGNTGASAVHHLPAPRTGRCVVALGMGGMGYSFGAAIGAALATGRRAFAIAGDGAFLMHGLEVHTAVQYGVPVSFVVLNNDAHGMCVTREKVFYGGRYSYNRFTPADPAAGLAALLPGLDSRTARDPAHLRRILADTAAGAGPVFACLDVDVDEYPPFAPLLTSLTPKDTSNEPVPVG